jgi:murein DD-endopeptidase MepM/ murein hydrolase activator NlpD
LRLQAHPTHRRVPRELVTVASVPVLVQIYLVEAGRRLSAAGPAVLVASLLATTVIAAQLTGGPVTAGPSVAYPPLPSGALQPVVPLGVRPADAVVVADAPSESRARMLYHDPEAGAPLIIDGPTAGAPRVVRFRPRPDQRGISRFAAVSVRFTEAMDHRSTEQAFRVTVGGRTVEGRQVWAESDTVLVLIPSHPLPKGARVKLAVTPAAKSAAGEALGKSALATFRVIAKPRQTTSRSATQPPRSSGWLWPLVGPITQYFGQHLTQYGFHQGIDIDRGAGDPVVAAHSGRVTVAGYWDSCGGLQVHIDHGNGLQSWYRHLSAINVHAGQWVSAGTLIGRIGSTGCSLGSHLHFGIRRNGTFVDPLRYLPRR